MERTKKLGTYILDIKYLNYSNIWTNILSCLLHSKCLVLFSNKCFVRFNGYALLYSSPFRGASMILPPKYQHLLFLLTSLSVSSNMMFNNELLELRNEFSPKNASDTTPDIMVVMQRVNFVNIQKQSSLGALKQRCSENMQQVYSRALLLL